MLLSTACRCLTLAARSRAKVCEATQDASTGARLKCAYTLAMPQAPTKETNGGRAARRNQLATDLSAGPCILLFFRLLPEVASFLAGPAPFRVR